MTTGGWARPTIGCAPLRRKEVKMSSMRCVRTAYVREADARTRTGDPFITSEVLYQLSYVGAARPV